MQIPVTKVCETRNIQNRKHALCWPLDLQLHQRLSSYKKQFSWARTQNCSWLGADRSRNSSRLDSDREQWQQNKTTIAENYPPSLSRLWFRLEPYRGGPISYSAEWQGKLLGKITVSCDAEWLHSLQKVFQLILIHRKPWQPKLLFYTYMIVHVCSKLDGCV